MAGASKASTSGGGRDPPTSLLDRIRTSFRSSVGSIVFGMEDGTVSIFGLVFGVAASAPDSHAVVLAGATGATAAAISMMAGTYLEVKSTNDQATTLLASERARYEANSGELDSAIRRSLVSAGFEDSEAETVADIFSRHPETSIQIGAALDLGISEAGKRDPFVAAAWMFLTDLFAASIPVIPFAVFALARARIVSLSLTFVLLLALGIGRSAIGHRRLVPTVAETIGIGAAAACAGVLVGKFFT